MIAGLHDETHFELGLCGIADLLSLCFSLNKYHVMTGQHSGFCNTVVEENVLSAILTFHQL